MYMASENSREEVYALGCSILELQGLSNQAIEQLRTSNSNEHDGLAATAITENFKDFSEQFKTLLRRMLKQNSEERPELHELQILGDKKVIVPKHEEHKISQVLSPSASRILSKNIYFLL